jgi:hypothetical protein
VGPLAVREAEGRSPARPPCSRVEGTLVASLLLGCQTKVLLHLLIN